MSDMLVKLYEFEPDRALYQALLEKGVALKRAMALDTTRVLDFVREHFSQNWADECQFALNKRCCWIAVKDREVVGFACYEATHPDYFGPTGVREDMRGLGVGRALLYRSLESMKEMGYAYAVIGWAGPKDFYRRAVGAVEIPDSIPGSYGDASFVP